MALTTQPPHLVVLYCYSFTCHSWPGKG